MNPQHTIEPLRCPSDVAEADDKWTGVVLPRAWGALRAVATAMGVDQADLAGEATRCLDEWRDLFPLTGSGSMAHRQLDTLTDLLQIATGDRCQRTIHDADIRARLIGRPPLPATHGTVRSLSLLFDDNSVGGIDARLEVTALNVQDISGLAGLERHPYSDPESNWHVVFEPDFGKASEQAWQYVREELGDEADSTCLRYRLVFDPRRDYTVRRPLRGTSAQAAFFLCFREAARAALGKPSLRLCPFVSVTACLVRAAGGRLALGPVGATRQKVLRAFDAGLDAVIVTPDNFEEAVRETDQRNQNLQGRSLRVLRAESVEEALQKATQLPEAVHVFLAKQTEELERIPFRLPNGRLLTNTELFVALRLIVHRPSGRPCRNASDGRLFESRPGISISGEEMAWDEFERGILPEKRHFAVVAPPGGGKSFVTRRLVLKATESARAGLNQSGDIALPLWITAAELACVPADVIPIGAAVAAVLRRRCGYSRLVDNLASWLSTHLDLPTTLLVVDALDEVGQSNVEGLTRRLAEMGAMKQARVIVTCRQHSWKTTWRHRLPWHDVTALQLIEFDDCQVDALLGNFLAHTQPDLAPQLKVRLTHDARLAGLCRNPLLLSYVCRLFIQGEDIPMQIRSAASSIYGPVVRMLLTGRNDAGRGPFWAGDAQVDEVFMLLSEVAWCLFRQNPSTYRLAAQSVISHMRGYRDERTRMGKTPAEFIDTLLEIGVLVPAGQDGDGATLYSLPHSTILEFLVAWHLTNMLRGRLEAAGTECPEPNVSQQLDLIHGNAWLPEWRGVILFLVQIEADVRDALVVELLNETKDDLHQDRRALVADASLEDSVLAERYPVLHREALAGKESDLMYGPRLLLGCVPWTSLPMRLKGLYFDCPTDCDSLQEFGRIYSALPRARHSPAPNTSIQELLRASCEGGAGRRAASGELQRCLGLRLYVDEVLAQVIPLLKCNDERVRLPLYQLLGYTVPQGHVIHDSTGDYIEFDPERLWETFGGDSGVSRRDDGSRRSAGEIAELREDFLAVQGSPSLLSTVLRLSLGHLRNAATASLREQIVWFLGRVAPYCRESQEVARILKERVGDVSCRKGTRERHLTLWGLSQFHPDLTGDVDFVREMEAELQFLDPKADDIPKELLALGSMLGSFCPSDFLDRLLRSFRAIVEEGDWWLDTRKRETFELYIVTIGHVCRIRRGDQISLETFRMLLDLYLFLPWYMKPWESCHPRTPAWKLWGKLPSEVLWEALVEILSRSQRAESTELFGTVTEYAPLLLRGSAASVDSCRGCLMMFYELGYRFFYNGGRQPFRVGNVTTRKVEECVGNAPPLTERLSLHARRDPRQICVRKVPV